MLLTHAMRNSINSLIHGQYIWQGTVQVRPLTHGAPFRYGNGHVSNQRTATHAAHYIPLCAVSEKPPLTFGAKILYALIEQFYTLSWKIMTLFVTIHRCKA